MNDNIYALAPGVELNHYIIESVLGSGGFGIVYKAHHAHLNEQVVIKEFLPVELAGRHGNTVAPHGTSKQELYSECLRRFMEEGRTLVKLRHPNVVRCRDLFTANGTAYLVMDFEDGLPLDELVRTLEAQGSRYTEQQLLHFLLPLADGLAYIHSQGVLHRDIKPANVFIRRSDGSPVIIDFGAAKQNFALASQSQAPFTEFYAPLEQIEGGGEAKPTVDIHAFGGLMYRLATGQMGPKAEARAMALVYGKPDPLPKAAELVQGQYSTAFLTTIDQCLAFKADERPQSMDVVKARLSAPEEAPVKAKKKTPSLSELDDLIALAGADAVITDSEMSMLLNKAAALGISQDKAQQYIVQQAVKIGCSVGQQDDKYAGINAEKTAPAASSNLIYCPSGSISGSLIWALPVGLLLAVISAVLYAVVTFVNPFIYIAFFIFFGFIVAIICSTTFILHYGRVRNPTVGMITGLVASLVGLYANWLIMLPKLAPGKQVRMELFNDPMLMWKAIELAADRGWYSVFGIDVNGVALWTIWGIEFIGVVLMAMFYGYEHTQQRVYCESCDRWTKEEDEFLAFELENEENVLQFIEQEDKRFLAWLAPANLKKAHCILTVQHCEKCCNLQAVSIKSATLDDDGKSLSTHSPIVSRFISSEFLSSLKQHKERLKVPNKAD